MPRDNNADHVGYVGTSVKCAVTGVCVGGVARTWRVRRALLQLVACGAVPAPD